MSVTKSVEVNCNVCIIWELEGYQWRCQCDSLSYLPIESVDDYRVNCKGHMSPKAASLVMPQLVLLHRCCWMLSDGPNHMRTVDPTQATMAHLGAPTRDQGGCLRYTWLTSSDATNGSCNSDYLLHDSIELCMLWRMWWVYHSSYEKSCRAIYGWKVHESTVITDMNPGTIDLQKGRVPDIGAAIADREAAL